MKNMTEKQIKKAIRNVSATLIVEGLEPSDVTIGYGNKFFRDEISIDEAVRLTTTNILNKKKHLNRS